MYCTLAEAYATAGITSTEVSEANMTIFILAAEDEVDRLVNTTQWSVEDNGTADAGAGDDELDDTAKTWTADDYIGDYVWIYSGTGSGQAREIIDNTTTKLTLDRDWTTNPDATSKYRIVHTGTNPYISNELREGVDTDTLFTKKYPLQILESVSIDSTSVTPSYIYQYKDTGKLKLSDDAEASYWTSEKAQLNVLAYWYGEYPIDGMAKRLCTVYAALKGLMAQAGGTHNIPSTYSLPEGSLTIGQAYVNIRGAYDMLNRERTELENKISKYAYFA